MNADHRSFPAAPAVPGSRSDIHATAALTALTAVTALFLSGYWIANRWTSTRADVGYAVFGWERAIPFVEWTVVPYLSILFFFGGAFFLCRNRVELRVLSVRLLSVLLIAIVCYALWPLRFTFDKPATTGFVGALFDALHAFDLPYNRAPSLHIAVVVILWATYAARVRGALRLALGAWFALIGVSVLTTYQHHVIDVPAGFAAGWASVRTFPGAGAAAVNLCAGQLRAWIRFQKSPEIAAR